MTPRGKIRDVPASIRQLRLNLAGYQDSSGGEDHGW